VKPHLQNEPMKTYYHFTSDILRDGRPVPPAGKWLRHEGELIPCEAGLHASEHPFDALQYAPGSLLHKVELSGEIIPHGNPVDKVCASGRKILATVNAEDLCRKFARRVALDVIDKWDAPKVVRDYLTTGDETLRDAAWDAAWTADRAVARDAALDAARAAACDAAYAAARDAACEAAMDAAWTAAWTAALTKYRAWFLEMVEAEFAKRDNK
jgi:hypothetical protein